MCVEGTLFPLGERASPFVEKNPAARATRYDDIPFCMGKQSKTCEIFELNGLFAFINFQIVFFWQIESQRSVIYEIRVVV